MKIYPVNDAQSRRQFLDIVDKIYPDYPNFIRPWDHDIEFVFDSTKNKFFRFGEIDRWLLKNDKGEVIGRVAAFINRKQSKKFDQPTGGMGFFECIDNKEAAFMLFDHCKAWLEERGMEAMDGPTNFGEKDKWWGLLVDGFDRQPLYRMNYHPPYYQPLFEAYGFQTYFKQYSYYREVQGQLDMVFEAKANKILENPDYHIPKYHPRDLEKYVEAFTTVFNKGWAKFEGFKEISKEQVRIMFKKLKPVADPDFVIFCYHKGEPVAFFLCIPDINPIVGKLNGKFSLWHKLKFLYYKKTRLSRKLFGVVYGVVPEHQGLGVEAAMARHAEIIAQRIDRYDDFEMGWIGDFNPKMLRTADLINTRLSKTHITYRKLFDETKPFKRRPIMGKSRKKKEEE